MSSFGNWVTAGRANAICHLFCGERRWRDAMLQSLPKFAPLALAPKRAIRPSTHDECSEAGRRNRSLAHMWGAGPFGPGAGGVRQICGVASVGVHEVCRCR